MRTGRKRDSKCRRRTRAASRGVARRRAASRGVARRRAAEAMMMTELPNKPDALPPPAPPPSPVLEYGTGRENAFVSLAGFLSETEAHLAASCLEGEGIICRVATGKALGGMGTYHAMVFVWPDDLERAREVL